MPRHELTLPTDEKVGLIYGAQHPGKGIAYLNAARMGLLKAMATAAEEYKAMERSYASQLAAHDQAAAGHGRDLYYMF
jgi:hypothetical protein